MPLISHPAPQKDAHCRNRRGHSARPTQSASAPLESKHGRRSSRRNMKLSQKGSFVYSISNPHQPFPYPLRDQLCHRCRVIDFRKVLSKGLAVDISKDSAAKVCLTAFGLPDFGSTDDLKRSRRCPFCRLLLDLVRRRSIIQPLWNEEEHWSIELVTTDDALFNFQRLPDSLSVYEHEREYSARG